MKVNKKSSKPNKVHNQEAVAQNKPKQNEKDKQKRERPAKNEIPSSERKTLEQLYSKGPAFLVAQSDFIHKAKFQWLNWGHI